MLKKFLSILKTIFFKFNKFLSIINPLKFFKKLFLHKKTFISACIFICLMIILCLYLIFRDKAYSISENADEIEVAKIDVKSYAPRDMEIYKDRVVLKELRVVYSSSVVKPEFIGVDISEKVTANPDVRGKWTFLNDNNLHFIPEKPWLPNIKYSFEVSKEVFSKTVDIDSSQRKFDFKTNPFVAELKSSSFYEDPIEIRKKQAVATYSFNYPIVFEGIKDKISIKSYSGDKYDFTVKQDESYPGRIHIMSDPIKIKKNEDYVEIKISGVENIYNKEKQSNSAIAKIKIPSSSTFFKINSINSRIIKNEEKNNEAEQILSVNFSTSVDDKSLDEYIEFYHYSDSCHKVRENVKKASRPSDVSGVKKLDIKRVSEKGGKIHLYKYDIVERNTCVFTRIRQGLQSMDGFMLSADEVRDLSASNYPLEAEIAFQGSILSLYGDRTVSFVSRGANSLDITVSRIDSKDLNHLASQTYGDFSNPYFRNYDFNEENISEIFRKSLKINMIHPAKQNYSSLDLNEYFKDKKGMFIVKINGKSGSSSTGESKRFILITDLGIIVKQNLDKSNDVFVSSFANGTPVSNAKISLLGKNGVSILEATTNEQGMAKIPNYKDFKNEKSPTVFVVSKDNDISFMGVEKSDRRQEVSSFDVGGVFENSNSNDKILKGFVFSDRGIYRPGETANFGIMVRDVDLDVPNKLAMEVDVRNSTGHIVANKKLLSDEYGLLDYSYKVASNAPVGEYSVILYDVSNSYRKHLATNHFKVEEFVPDNMKIKLRFENISKKGWYNQKELKSVANLQNLYGKPSIEHDIKATLKMNPKSFYFSEYKDYNFKDPLVKSGAYHRSYNENLTTQKSDKEGNASFAVDLGKFERGTYVLSLDVIGYELEGGRSVFTSENLLVSPLEYLIGYKKDGQGFGNIAKDSERNIEFIVIDNQLNKIEKQDLLLKIVEMEYIRSLVEMPNGTYQYQYNAVEKVLSNKDISIYKAGNNLSIDTKKSGDYYIQVENKEGDVLSRVDYKIAGGKNSSFEIDKDAKLSVTLDKKQYNNGDVISMKINSSYEGYGLITIERDKVYNYKWFKTSAKSTTEEIRLPYTVEGNAYISVSFVRSAKSREIFMPPMSYSIVPFEINRDKRTAKIDLDFPEVVKSGEDLVIKYKASKKGKIILYGVNEGILQVAKYKTPDPIGEFVKKRAHRIVSYQIMDLIMPDMKLFELYKATGGDDMDLAELLSQQNPFARKQSEVVAFWSGVIDVDTSYKEYKYKIPAIFNGSIKIMAVSVSEDVLGSTDGEFLHAVILL